MLQQVKTEKTFYTQLEFCAALIEAWKELTGHIPSRNAVGVIWAQHGIETGNGSFCFCNNLANVKAVDIPGQTIQYCALNNVWEIIGGKKFVLKPTDPGSWFRAFPTLLDGMRFQLDLLKNRRYASSWSSVEAGDVVAFATALKNRGYYTAPLSDYIAGMNRFFNPFVKSNTYDHALAMVEPDIAPPLQPWVAINVEPAPEGTLTVLPEPLNIESPIQQGIDRAGQVPQAVIEKTTSSIIGKIVSFIGMIFQWMTQRK
jgi:hypothetical protein